MNGQKAYLHKPEGIHALQHYQAIQRRVEGDIHDTHSELRQLNNKIVKNDYQHNLMKKLELKHQMLIEKHRQLEEAIKNQQYMQHEMEIQKANDKKYQHTIADQYNHLSEEKRRKVQEEKKRQIQQERYVHQLNRRSIEEDYLRKKQAKEEQKRQVLEELAMRDKMRARQKEEKQRQKEEFNQKVMIRNQIQTQKDSVYKQYYSQFMDNQDTLQNIYKNKAAITDREREQRRNDFQRKEIEQFQQRALKDQEIRVKKMNEEKDMLRSYLQNQIEEKQRRKSLEREEELNYQNQVARYQTSYNQAEQMQRNRRKEQQRRYDEELKNQTRNSRAYSRNNGNGEGFGTPQQPHNPITNPIDFRIGYTNPYVLKEYQQAKEKLAHDNHQLKLRNLAMVGSASLNHQ